MPCIHREIIFFITLKNESVPSLMTRGVFTGLQAAAAVPQAAVHLLRRRHPHPHHQAQVQAALLQVQAVHREKVLKIILSAVVDGIFPVSL
jgi:hypothetical protein